MIKQWLEKRKEKRLKENELFAFRIAGIVKHEIPRYFYHEMFASIGIDVMRKLVEKADENRKSKGHYDYEDIAYYYQELTERQRVAEYRLLEMRYKGK